MSSISIKPQIDKQITKEIPSAQREFRAVWVATVDNIDWPSEPGLTTEEQKRQAIAILDTTQKLNLNAIIFQVRPQCDAFYSSEIEPWSYYLTGQQGKAPNSFYDPSEFWIKEAHIRGMELHVWFNPYRAHHPKGGEVSKTSIVNTNPEIVKELRNGYFWLDPAKKETQDYSLNVVMDVVKRYDIDGVHLDDYFYPYPSYNNNEDFPDNDSWEKYQKDGGTLNRKDWRRDGVNKFVKRLYTAIKKEKTRVKFGLSPFGIWRPNFPESIRGFDQYNVLYSDCRLWLNEGWIDYMSPQLYWKINQVPQSFPVLLGWWVRENKKGRNIWLGMYTSKAKDSVGVDEINNQIMITRGFVPESPGHIHFSMKALLENHHGINDGLKTIPYKNQALVPPSPWLDVEPPIAPELKLEISHETLTISWTHGNESDVFRRVVYFKQGKLWSYKIFNRNDRTYSLPLIKTVKIKNKDGSENEIQELVTQIAVTAVDREGNESIKTIKSITT